MLLIFFYLSRWVVVVRGRVERLTIIIIGLLIELDVFELFGAGVRFLENQKAEIIRLRLFHSKVYFQSLIAFVFGGVRILRFILLISHLLLWSFG